MKNENDHDTALSLLRRIATPGYHYHAAEVEALTQFMTDISFIDRLAVWSYIAGAVSVDAPGIAFMKYIHPFVRELCLEPFASDDADVKIYVDVKIAGGRRPRWTPAAHVTGEWKKTLNDFLAKHR